jgi:pimeloyl-ACP methyl ester carboxylesterase
MEPTAILNGLAIYKLGSGEPVFVMPYPHACTFSSIADDSLTQSILKIGKSVITFDPPGAYNSRRPAKVDMQEMINCTNETLDYFKIDKIDIVGHSMGSFCAMAYTIKNQERVKRIVLIGCTSGWTAMRKWGVHKTWKWWKDKEFWQTRYFGTKVYLGLNNLKNYNKLNNIVEKESYVDKKYVHLFIIEKGDNKKPVPIRGKWLENVRLYDYKNEIQNIKIPTLIIVGKYDPQTPLIMNKELNVKIEKSKLIVLNNSGHSPFIEENKEFLSVISNFLSN